MEDGGELQGAGKCEKFPSLGVKSGKEISVCDLNDVDGFLVPEIIGKQNNSASAGGRGEGREEDVR